MMEFTGDSLETTPGAGGVGTHLFSVDVEEYFHVNAFDGFVRREDWSRYPSRVDASVETILEALGEAEATATFFILGWLASKRPHLVRSIAEAGHEIASHSFWHRRVTSLDVEEFREDVRQSRAVLEDLSGTSVLGYRAPSFSIVPGMEWAFDVLLEEGYRYDSSRFPIWRPGYGSPGTPRVPHWIHRASGRLLEIPMATTSLMGLVTPAAGGGYLRQFPLSLLKRAFREADSVGAPAMFYVHPWEIDPDQPRLPLPMLTRIRHYRGQSRTLPRIRELLTEFRFNSVRVRFPDLANPPADGAT